MATIDDRLQKLYELKVKAASFKRTHFENLYLNSFYTTALHYNNVLYLEIFIKYLILLSTQKKTRKRILKIQVSVSF